MAFAPTVAAEDDQGQVETASSGPITVSLLGSTGATLAGPLTINFAGGQATFGDLSLTGPSQGYSPNLAPGGLLATTAGPIAEAAAAVKTLSPFSSGRATVGVGTTINVAVAPVHALGNSVTSYTGAVRLTTTDPAVPNPSLTRSRRRTRGSTVPDPAPDARVRTISATDSTLSASLLIRVVQAATGALLTSNKAPDTPVQPVRLTSKVVRTAPGAGTQGGSVTFLDGTTRLRTATLDPTSVANSFPPPQARGGDAPHRLQLLRRHERLDHPVGQLDDLRRRRQGRPRPLRPRPGQGRPLPPPRPDLDDRLQSHRRDPLRQ